MKIGFNFSLVKQFINLSLSFFAFLCSCIKNGINITETVVYLQEFLVNDQERTSPISQQGTKDAKRLLIKRIVQAKKELTSIVLLNYSSSDPKILLRMSYFYFYFDYNLKILGFLSVSTLYIALFVPHIFDCLLVNLYETLSMLKFMDS